MGTNETDYDRLIRPIQDRMVRSIWRILKDPNDAEDALQDALASIWKRRGRVRRHPNPQALILRMCINAAYDVLRRKAHRPGHQTLDSVEGGVLTGNDAFQQEQDGEVRRAVARLPRNQAVAVLMRVVGEEPYDAIAHALGCSEATARTHVARARARLRHLLAHLLPGRAQEATS